MKFAKYLIIALAAGVLSVSCTDDEDNYVPAPASDVKSSVYFPENQNGTHAFLLEENVEVTVDVKREDKGAARTVKIDFSTVHDDLIKSCDNVATFKEGEDVAKVKVQLNKEKMEAFKNYAVYLNVDPAEFNPYKQQDITPSVRLNFVREDYAPFAKGEFNDPFIAEAASQKVLEWSEILKVYRLSDPWGTGEGEIIFSVDDKNKIHYKTPSFSTGYVHPKYGLISAFWEGFENKQYYNAEKKVYNFHFDMKVSAGSFGDVHYTFAVKESLMK